MHLQVRPDDGEGDARQARPGPDIDHPLGRTDSRDEPFDNRTVEHVAIP